MRWRVRLPTQRCLEAPLYCQLGASRVKSVENEFYAAKLLTEELLDDLVERLKEAVPEIAAKLRGARGDQSRCDVDMAQKGTESMNLLDKDTSRWPYLRMKASLPHRGGMLSFSFSNGGGAFEGGLTCRADCAFRGSGSSATEFRAPAVSYGNFTFAHDEEREEVLKRWRLWSGEVLAAFREAMKEFVRS